MIDGSFVQEIVNNASPIKPQERIHEVRDAHGRYAQYTDLPLKEIEAKAPALPTLVTVFTLQGFAELVAQKLDGLDVADYVAHVEDVNKVSLVGRKTDEWGRRARLIEAVPVKYEGFPFARWLDQEQFIIQFASRFSPSTETDYNYIVDIASSITAQASRAATDNGLAQQVTLKRGMQVPKQDQEIRPRVKLAPYRIFPECQQPISEFLFRLKGGDESHVPELALIEADGGQWKIAAINEVRRFLSTLNLGVPIIA